jgi:hypothetical protein
MVQLPQLIGDVATTERIDRETAVPLAPLLPACGPVGQHAIPNNVYGCGAIDAAAAVRMPLQPDHKS